ncbi:hypothetical protein [Teredinibacter franksiae]|uniref:hypothetical protein n=1 Tax=Teredinibacter franksiae TaxID=2761453 RepID=UPI001C8A74B2|nr:hypothetical protein [Teredinibacter franksiae]
MKEPTLGKIGVSILGVLLIALVPMVGLLMGTLPSRGIDPSFEEYPVKFVVVLLIWLLILLAAVFNAVLNIQSLFKKYGSNYNWATLKAIFTCRHK